MPDCDGMNLEKGTLLPEKMKHFNLNFIPAKIGVYIVGGCVRDFLMGNKPEDFDIVVDGDTVSVAEEIAARAGTRVIELGKPGKKIYRVQSETAIFDVSPLKGNTVTGDLTQRDFTVNAMAIDVCTREITDPTGGCDDIKKKIVRMTSADIFRDDPIRLLRAFRITAGLGFTLDTGTMEEIRRNASAITAVAGERIREEWIRLLGMPDSVDALRHMSQAGLLAAIFPELAALKNCSQNEHHEFDVLEHTLAVYHRLETLLHQDKPRLSDHFSNIGLAGGGKPPGPSRTTETDAHAGALLKHAALLHDIGKPATRKTDAKENVHFYGHETAGFFMVRTISDRLRFSSRWKNYVSFLVRHHLRPLFLYIAQSKGRKKNLARTRFFLRTDPFSPDLILLFAADMMGKKKDPAGSCEPPEVMEFARAVLSDYFDGFRPKRQCSPPISGRDLMACFGLRPSPLIAEILEKVERQYLAGYITDKAEALSFAENYIRSKNRS